VTRTPKTNGMVERSNGRISDVLKTNHFNSAEDLEQTLLRYAALYNHQLPQSALKSKTPMQAMKIGAIPIRTCSISDLMIVRDVTATNHY
jgi:transposase InsO family protein